MVYDVDQRLIPSFVAVADAGNVTRAAAELSLSQPALSAQLRRLERQLGAELFARSAAGVTLTPAGEAFLPRAREIVTLTRLAIHEVQAVAGAERLRIDVHDEALVIPRMALDRLHKSRTPLEISAIGVPLQDRRLLDGRLDLALAGHRRQLPGGLVQHPVAAEPLGVAVSAKHRLADLPEVELTQLRDEEFYVPRPTFSPDWTAMVEKLCHNSGFAPRIASVTTESSRLPMTLVGRGDCVAISLLSTPVPATVRVLRLTNTADFEWTVRYRRDARATVRSAAESLAGLSV